MRFNPEILDRDAEREFRYFFRWTGEQTWRDKIDTIETSRVFLRRMSIETTYGKEPHWELVTLTHQSNVPGNRTEASFSSIP